MNTYKGILLFHSETGTEGGYWAFQDEKFMHLPAPNQLSCTRCNYVWDKDKNEKPPVLDFVYWHEEENGFGSYRSQPDFDPDGNLGPSELDKAIMKDRNDRAKKCLDGHEGWKQMYPDGMWFYEGLHIIRDGDQLKIYDKDPHDEAPRGRDVLWEGTVKFPPEQDPYAKDSYHCHGLAAHFAPPEDVNKVQWEEWFLKEYPAELTQH